MVMTNCENEACCLTEVIVGWWTIKKVSGPGMLSSREMVGMMIVWFSPKLIDFSFFALTFPDEGGNIVNAGARRCNLAHGRLTKDTSQ